MRAGLHYGALLADQVGAAEIAAKWRAVKGDIEATLQGHYDGAFVFESSNRRKDAAVIEAFNVGDLGDGMFAPISKPVIQTVIMLNSVFCGYPINQQDSAQGVPGVLYGRYEGDTYHGGNPWVLLTAALARLAYRQALAASQADVLDSDTYVLLQEAYGISDGLTGRLLGDALLGVGDGIMLRIRHHAKDADFHMAEQIDKNDGSMVSAKDLTWNYANILLAMRSRNHYVTGKSFY